MAMLDLKPSCECCDTDLPPESPHARICTYECTYCAPCADEMHGMCENCGGCETVQHDEWLDIVVQQRPEYGRAQLPAKIERDTVHGADLASHRNQRQRAELTRSTAANQFSCSDWRARPPGSIN